MMSRRDCLKAIAVAGPALAAGKLAADTKPRTSMGIAITSYAIRSAEPNSSFKNAHTFLQHCRELGAGGIQTHLGSDSDAAKKIRADAETWGMYVEGQVTLPKSKSDVAAFEKTIETAKQAGG